MRGCLYKLTFSDGKSYIGITSRTLHHRLSGHLGAAHAGKPQPICEAIRKLGKPKAKILLGCQNWEQLCEAERAAIEEYGTLVPNGYNVSSGGGGFPIRYDGIIRMIAERSTEIQDAIKRRKAILMPQHKAAAFIGVSSETMRRWNFRHRGPPHIRIGKRRYYSREMLLQWVQSVSLSSSPAVAGTSQAPV